MSSAARYYGGHFFVCRSAIVLALIIFEIAAYAIVNFGLLIVFAI